ncbi:MAG TPA: YdeI/OmpD-associated family protein [Flavisolibacter sp.]|nr:YdeI/OmpD-associated family protein [Flavisolibacter sp.]
MEMQTPIFFKSLNELHKWFQKNHSKVSEVWIGFYKVNSGKRSISYKEAVDEALCFGWIDGIRKGLDEESYVNRFTPRKKSSNWSNVNIKRINELIEEGRVHPTGLAAFKERTKEKSGVYSFEQDSHKLSPAFEKKFKANKKAWSYFTSKAPWYQRTSIHWVMSAKQESTRLKRLETLITDSENEKTIALLTRQPKK